MRIKLVILTLSLAAMGCSQAPPLFSPAERDSVLKYWSRPDRYTVSLPSDGMDKGIWQVRLTVAGSTWLWNYSRGKNLPPTVDIAPPTTEDQAKWEAWIAARINRDRWDALQVARQANQQILGKNLPADEKSLPTSEPADPGPIPEALRLTVGNPPRFAEAAVPMQHEIAFDDTTLKFTDRFKTWSPRYAYYRYDLGVGDGGTAVKNMPKERLNQLFSMANVSEVEAKVMRTVSLLEGGFDSVNTYDTGYVSVGFIQFACLKEGGGSLGQMLKSYKVNNPDTFQRDFRTYGLDVTDDGKLATLDLVTGAELTGAEAAAKIIEDKRLIAVFQHAGRLSDPFIAAQIRAAKALYLPINDPITISCDGKTLSGALCDFIKSEAGMATLMDRKVNTGNLDVLPTVLVNLAAQIKPSTLADFAPYERLIVEAVRYRKDYLSEPTLSQPPLLDPTSRGAGGTRNQRNKGTGTKPKGR